VELSTLILAKMNFIEEFRVIDNYDGKYKVSNKGNIFCKPNP